MTDQDSAPVRPAPLARLIVSGETADIESATRRMLIHPLMNVSLQQLVPDGSGNDPLTKYSFDHLKTAMKADRGYAWAWHCNLAVPLMDSIGITHEQANKAATVLMRHMFDVDVTQFPEYKQLKLEETA